MPKVQHVRKILILQDDFLRVHPDVYGGVDKFPKREGLPFFFRINGVLSESIGFYSQTELYSDSERDDE